MLEALRKVPFKEWEKLKSTPKNKYTPRQALISLVNALEEEHMGLSNYVEDEYNILSQALDKPAPVVHAKWVETANTKASMVSCTNCKKMQAQKSNYCPNCGAKMDTQ